MMQVLFVSESQSDSRVPGLKQVVPVLLFSCFALLSATAQVGLPRAAVAIPAPHGDQDIAATLNAADQCKLPGQFIVLPPVLFQPGGVQSLARPFEEQTKVVQAMPRGPELWLHVVVGSSSLTGSESEKLLTEQVDVFLKQAPLSVPGVRGMIVELSESSNVPDSLVFTMLRLAVGAKSNNGGLRLAFVFRPGFIGQHGDIVKRLATYSDLLGATYSKDWRSDSAWISENGFNKPLILKLDAGAPSAPSSYLEAALAASGSAVEILWSNPAEIQTANQLCSVGNLLTRSIPPNMLRLDSAALPFTITMDGVKSDDSRWFGNGQSPDLVVVAPVNATPGNPRSVALHGTAKAQYEIQWYDPATGNRLPAGEQVTTGTGMVQTCACTAGYALINIHKKSDNTTAVYNQVEVKGGVELSVEEIIARWQQYREAQKQRLENYQSSSFMNIHFETTNVASAFDISMRIKQFYSRGGQMELAQTEFYVNGVKFSNKHAFPLPQLEPQKVLTQPLELKLNERYAYKLLGTEKIDGALCFVVGVEPKVQDEALYSGKIWIDGTSFREVRQLLSQRGNNSNIVVNVETQNFALVDDGKGNQFNLLRSISAQQTLNAAGRDFQLQRTLQFSDYAINIPQFNDTLTSEHNSDDPMYRETDQGLGELKKKGGERVLVENNRKRIISLVVGAMYQGTFNFPIPIAGISMADFDFRHTGAQLSTFFAGPILVNNLSKQYSPKLRLGLDLALSGLPGESRIYVGNVENTGQAVWNWEETVGGRASWQASNHLSVTGFTYMAYDFYRKTSDTASTYELPRNGIALLPGVQIRATQKGYIFTANGTRGQRIAWRNFGNAQFTALPQPAYTLYDADLNKDYYIKKFTKGGWDLAYYGGVQQDRFSRYFPSFFSSPRLHGIPGGTDSFDAIAMANVHYGFNVMDLMKFEGLYSYARARNLEESSHFKRFDGVETNFNTAGPKGTLIQGTVSYALNGNIPRYNSRLGFNVMIFKPF